MPRSGDRLLLHKTAVDVEGAFARRSPVDIGSRVRDPRHLKQRQNTYPKPREAEEARSDGAA